MLHQPKTDQVKPSFHPTMPQIPVQIPVLFRPEGPTMHPPTSKHNNSSGVRLNPQPQSAKTRPPVSSGRPSRTKGPPRGNKNSPDAALAALTFSFFFLAALALVLRPIVIGDAVRSSGRVARGYRTLFTACLSELVRSFIYLHVHVWPMNAALASE